MQETSRLWDTVIVVSPDYLVSLDTAYGWQVFMLSAPGNSYGPRMGGDGYGGDG